MKSTYEARWGHPRTRKVIGYYRARKEQKRREAIERQKKYDALSIDEKIALAKSRPGNSAKELARLQRATVEVSGD